MPSIHTAAGCGTHLPPACHLRRSPSEKTPASASALAQTSPASAPTNDRRPRENGITLRDCSIEHRRPKNTRDPRMKTYPILLFRHQADAAEGITSRKSLQFKRAPNFASRRRAQSLLTFRLAGVGAGLSAL